MITARLTDHERARLLAGIVAGCAKDSPSWAASAPALQLDAAAETNELIRETNSLLRELINALTEEVTD